jgi:hypothetical protein
VVRTTRISTDSITASAVVTGNLSGEAVARKTYSKTRD